MRPTRQSIVVTVVLGSAVLLLLVAWGLTLLLGNPSLAILAAAAVAVPLAWLAASALNRRIDQPVHRLTELVDGIGRGEWHSRLPIEQVEEMAALGQAINQLAERSRVAIAEISAERARLQAVLTSMVEGVLVLDRQGRILLMNNALCRMLPGAEPSAVGRSWLEVFRHHPLNEFIGGVLKSGEGRRQELTLLTLGEPTFLIQASVARSELNGQSETGPREERVAAVLVFHDITELKRLERVRKDFVANVSHELKTPLTSIAGYVEALLDGAKDDPKKCEEFLAIVRKHTEGLNAILTDLLQLSTVESGVYRWKRDPVVVGELVERAARVLRPVAERRRQQLTVHPCDPALQLWGDGDRLTEAIINLLDNAVKYTPEGGAITVDATADEAGVRIAVTDTGVGIPPKECARIFERFYRVDRARPREHGTGLGLSIVKHIIEAHGGRVSVESVVGRGSVFSVILPVQPTFP